jgi:uncharacterized protein
LANTSFNSQQHIVVTGATGFLGRPLVSLLLAQGYTVTALVRNPEKAKKVLPESVRLVKWQPPELPPVSIFLDAHAVIHLAGESVGNWPWNRSRRQLLWDSRILATRALVDSIQLACQSDPGRQGSDRGDSNPAITLISASGMGYHGDAGSTPVTESSPPGDDFMGWLAQAWETEALRATQPATAKANRAIRVVCLRFGMILARQGGALQALARPFRLGLGARLGSGQQGQPWIHRDDAMGLILHALSTSSLLGPVHAIAPTTPSQREFAKVLSKVLHRPVWWWAPAFLLRLALGEFSAILLHGQYGKPEKAIGTGYRFRHPDLAMVLKECLL